MKIRSAERLLFVAIVTSAVVAQIRVHTLPSDDTDSTAHATTTAQTGPMQSCGDTHDSLLRAACETPAERRPVDSGDRSINRADTPRSNKLWV
jgi:hypothetical protein